jgi:DNA-binding XRE family transcriptional regulator
MTRVEQFLIWRRRHGWSQKAAAKALGTTLSVIRRVERGKISPRQFMVSGLIEYFPEIPSPGEELWLMRRRHGLRKSQAAAILDCSMSQLYLLEHDKASIKYRDLTDIERAYVALGL